MVKGGQGGVEDGNQTKCNATLLLLLPEILTATTVWLWIVYR